MSIDEMENIDPDLFQALEVYKSCMSSKQEKMDMLYHTHTCYLMAMYNPNLPANYKKTLKYSDFDFMDMLDDSLTTKERRLKREQQKNINQAQEINSIGEMIKNMAIKKDKK